MQLSKIFRKTKKPNCVCLWIFSEETSALLGCRDSIRIHLLLYLLQLLLEINENVTGVVAFPLEPQHKSLAAPQQAAALSTTSDLHAFVSAAVDFLAQSPQKAKAARRASFIVAATPLSFIHQNRCIPQNAAYGCASGI
jgi:hypothetical protein